MNSTKWRALVGLAVAFLLTPATLRSEESVSVLSDLYSAPAFAGARSFAQVDDLVELNAQGVGHRGEIADDTESSSATVVDSTAAIASAPVSAESHWILGAIGAVLVMGLGVTFAGVYFSGPRYFARIRRNHW